MYSDTSNNYYECTGTVTPLSDKLRMLQIHNTVILYLIRPGFRLTELLDILNCISVFSPISTAVRLIQRILLLLLLLIIINV